MTLLRQIAAIAVLMPLAVLLSGCSSSSTVTVPPAPVASLSAASVTFPSITAGATSPAQTVTLSNTGNASLTITGITLAGANPADFAVSSGTCGATLAVAATCAISVTFSPAAALNYASLLVVTDNAAGSPQTATLTGTGTLISLTPSNLSFPFTTIGAVSAPQVLTLSNQGSSTLNISGISLSGANTSSFAESTTCGSTLTAGSSCTISLTYTVGSAPSYTAIVSVADNVTGSPQTATLTGLGPEPNNCKSTATSPTQPAPTPNYAGHAFTGSVMAGSLPVIGASVQVYAAGMTGNGSAPTALLATPLVTGSNGAFSVPATFTCPYSNSVLYAVARGGKAGASGSINSGMVFATVLGQCNSLTGTPGFVLNEATTVATAWAMSQFLAPGGSMGATATNSLGIGQAAATAANLASNLGTVPGVYFPANGTPPTTLVDMLANLLNACAVSTGPTSTACSQLYSNTAVSSVTPTNTLDAALNMAHNPGLNVAALYTLSLTSSAYTPVPAAAPTDWTMYINFTGGGMSGPSGVAVDSTGRVWVGNYFYVASQFSNTGAPIFPAGVTLNGLNNSYGAAVDANDYAWIPNEQGGAGLGSVSVFNTAGQPIADYTTGGFNFSIATAVDSSNLTWVVNYGNSTVTLLSNTGTPLSGSGGFSGVGGGVGHFFFPVAVAVDSKCNSFIANQSSNTITRVLADGSSYVDFVVGEGPSGVAVDGNDNGWAANYYGNSVGLVSSAGKVLSGAGYTGGGIDHPQGIAVDGAGTVWVVSYRSPTSAGDALSELAGANTANPGAALSPSTGWGTDANMLEAFGLAIDSSGNIWITNFSTNTLTEFVGMAAPVKTPLLGPVRVP